MEQEVIKEPLPKQGPEALGIPEVPGAERARVDAKPLERPQESGASPADVVIPDTEAGPSVSREQAPFDFKDVEGILSEDLGEIYAGLPDDIKPAFRAAGEDVARKIHGMLVGINREPPKIIDALRQWLRLLPGGLSPYLEQGIKIKVDKLMRLGKPELN